MGTYNFTPEQLVEAAKTAYAGTKQYYDYADKHVIPVLVSQLGLSQYEHALISVYYRLHLLMQTLTRLDSYHDFQVVRATARSMFELTLDVRTLKMNPQLAVRFFSFPKIERMRTALRVADFVSLHPGPEMAERYKYQLRLAADVQAIADCEAMLLADFGIQTCIATDGAKKFPKSWVHMPVRTQAAALGVEVEARYLADYSIASWFVHGGFAGMESISLDGFVVVYLRGQWLAVKSFHDATFVVAQELRLFDAQPELWTHIKYLEQLSFHLFSEYMKGLGWD
jgi:hypothetical protein